MALARGALSVAGGALVLNVGVSVHEGKRRRALYVRSMCALCLRMLKRKRQVNSRCESYYYSAAYGI